jgi:phospholipase/lecithinase/hemolysin
MNKMDIKRSYFYTILLLCSLLLPNLANAAKPANGIVVFGDSLSDTGNKYFITGFANTPPYSELLDFFLVADGPYTRGGLHHSNGATWVEQYARPRGQAGDVRPALRSQGKASNYAYGGARARPDFPIIANANQHFPTQVDNFLADVNNSAPADALYVIFIGGNDIFDAVYALSFDPSSATSTEVITRAVTSVVTQVMRLAAAGAQHIVILNAPDLGATPAVKLADAEFSPIPGAVIAAATDFAQAYNFGLIAKLAGVQGVEIIDIFTTFNELINNPEDFGLSNSTDVCVMPEQPPYACKQPNDYVFWDGVHPTKAAHGILADMVGKALAE